MVMMLSYMLDRLLAPLRNERGVVSVEWIILAIVIMVAIVAAFAPTLQTALTNGVTAVSNALTTQAGNAAGS
ncbi:MAG TPA: Flp family type IVb pilin [Methylomirabilota bacterium]|jgi:Flp pilus assembly pilin Flp